MIRYGLFNNFENNFMRLGTFRHKQWQTESEKTGFLPVCFKEILPNKKNLKVSCAEFVIENEIMPGVVLHSTIDAYLAGDYVADYKTTSQDANVYGSSQQLIVYAYQLSLQGIDIKRAIFLLEKWDEKREKIIGYQKNEKKIENWKIEKAKAWIEERVVALKIGIEEFEKDHKEEIERAKENRRNLQGSPESD